MAQVLQLVKVTQLVVDSFERSLEKLLQIASLGEGKNVENWGVYDRIIIRVNRLSMPHLLFQTPVSNIILPSRLSPNSSLQSSLLFIFCKLSSSFFIPPTPKIKTEHEPGGEKPSEVGSLLPGEEQSPSRLARREITMTVTLSRWSGQRSHLKVVPGSLTRKGLKPCRTSHSPGCQVVGQRQGIYRARASRDLCEDAMQA